MFLSYLMMRVNIKQQRWDHANSLLTTDISLERKKKKPPPPPNSFIFHKRMHFFCNKLFKSLYIKLIKQLKPQL